MCGPPSIPLSFNLAAVLPRWDTYCVNCGTEGALVYLLFCVTKYGWGWDNYKKEVNTGKGLKMHDWMRGYLTYVLPVIVLFIFAFGIYDKFFA